jgi:hypothetical protein
MEVDMSTNAPLDSPVDAASDRLLGAITDALEQLQQDTYDPEVLAAASEVTGEDMFSAWRPPFGFVSPHKDGDVYRVSVFANTACSNCQPNHLDVEGLQTRLRELVGSGRIVVDDYFDVFDWSSGSYCAAER